MMEVFRAASLTNENRTFWTNHENTFSVVGFGEAKRLVVGDESQDRFFDLQAIWNEVLEEAMIHDPYEEMGTGLMAIGGMAFDPKRETTDLWKHYPSGRLTIPSYIIVHAKGKYYMTVNRYLQVDDLIPDVVAEIEYMEEQVIRGSLYEQDEIPQRIINKKVIAPEAWKSSVQKAVNEIKNHHAKKIVMARELRITLNRTASISDLLQRLLESQSNSYVFAFEEGEDCFIGATPERLVLVESNRLLSTCLAGTAPRGKTKHDDEKIAHDLLHDEKNREEHAYVVQMIKDSIHDYCEDMEIPDAPVIYPLRNLQHLYTPVQATLKSGYSVFDLIKKLHPTPALGGVPTETALAFMREHELLDRGWYGAPIGWLDSNGISEFAVALRSGLVQANEVSLFAGCGIMRDSDPEMEFEETKMKFLPILQVLEENNEPY